MGRDVPDPVNVLGDDRFFMSAAFTADPAEVRRERCGAIAPLPEAMLGSVILIQKVNDFPVSDCLFTPRLKTQQKRMKFLECLFLANLEGDLGRDVVPTLEG